MLADIFQVRYTKLGEYTNRVESPGDILSLWRCPSPIAIDVERVGYLESAKGYYVLEPKHELHILLG
jgi:hypothetical protein